MTQPSLADRLRAETAAEHEAIEGVVGLMSDTVDRSEYRRYLEQTYGFLEPLEARLHARLAATAGRAIDWDERRKTPSLEADLRALGATEADLDALPRAQGFYDSLAGATEEAEAWGAAYVLEGSTLGGRLIHRHLTGPLGEDLGAYRFLDVYGAETGARWRAFKAALDALPADWADAAVDGAKKTFVAMREFMSRGPGDHGANQELAGS